MIREAYQQAAQFFVDTVAQVRDSQWEQVGLGEWTVRDLVGHTNRALLTVETYLATPATTAELQRPVEYFLRAAASLGDPAAVAARGREAGKALGAEPLATVRDTAQRVLQRVAAASDTTLLKTPVGGMRLLDYLPPGSGGPGHQRPGCRTGAVGQENRSVAARGHGPWAFTHRV